MLFDIIKTEVHDHYPVYRNQVLESLSVLKDDPSKMIQKVINRNPYSLVADDPYITPAQLIKSILLQRVQPSKETIMGGYFQDVICAIAKRFYEPLGCRVTIPERNGDSLDLEISPVAGIRGLKVEFKSGPTWGNSQARKKFAEKMANKYHPDYDLIEGIVCGRDSSQYVHNGVVIQRLCGADLYERLFGDRSVGYVILETMRMLECEEAMKNPSGSLDGQINTYLDHMVKNFLDVYQHGYKGLALWNGNRINWSNLFRLNSGDWTAHSIVIAVG